MTPILVPWPTCSCCFEASTPATHWARVAALRGAMALARIFECAGVDYLYSGRGDLVGVNVVRLVRLLLHHLR